MSMDGSLRAGGPTPPCAVTGRPFPWRTGTIKSMRDRARGAGVRTVAYALMDDHIHWIVIAESRGALAAATRLVFGQLARRINRAAGRARGRVFADRFWSSSGRSVRQAFQMVAYVLRNPYDAACLPALEGPVDPYLGLDLPLLSADRFLRSVFGPRGPGRDALLARMLTERVPFVPLAVRRQASLPGLG